jgi:general secretion pathway protein E
MSVRPTLPPDAHTWYLPGACRACEGTGYAGRIGIFEVLAIDNTLRDAIATGVSSATLAQYAAATGHRSLFDDAAQKLLAGITSFDEIERVVGWWLR